MSDVLDWNFAKPTTFKYFSFTRMAMPQAETIKPKEHYVTRQLTTLPFLLYFWFASSSPHFGPLLILSHKVIVKLPLYLFMYFVFFIFLYYCISLNAR